MCNTLLTLLLLLSDSEAWSWRLTSSTGSRQLTATEWPALKQHPQPCLESQHAPSEPLQWGGGWTVQQLWSHLGTQSSIHTVERAAWSPAVVRLSLATNDACPADTHLHRWAIVSDWGCLCRQIRGLESADRDRDARSEMNYRFLLETSAVQCEGDRVGSRPLVAATP